MGAKEDAFDNRDRKDILTFVMAGCGLALMLEANLVAYVEGETSQFSHILFTAGSAAVFMLLLRIFVAEPLSGPNKPVKP